MQNHENKLLHIKKNKIIADLFRKQEKTFLYKYYSSVRLQNDCYVVPSPDLFLCLLQKLRTICMNAVFITTFLCLFMRGTSATKVHGVQYHSDYTH